MAQIGDSERNTQDRVIKFFHEKLHYTFIGNLHDRENSNIIEDRLYAYLKRCGYSEQLIKGAVDALKKAAVNMQQELYAANKEVYSLLKYGAKIKEDIDKPAKTVYFIDFEETDKNDFYIAEEVTIIENHEKRPDLVIYVNGIALAVIELKNSRVSVSSGIRQNITNQNAHFIERFFTTIQLCVAGNESEGMRYGTIKTPEKYYLEWKDDAFTESKDDCDETDLIIEEKCRDIPERLYKELFCLFYKERLLDLIHNFIVFDKGRKKICRYNQYYAIKRAQNRLARKNQGGIIWHTQGSGKSLSMVWLSKWLLANYPNARVLIVTDREELDTQIESIYKGVDVNVVRTKSGSDLIRRLSLFEDRLICSLIHKFGRRGKDTKDEDYDKYIQDLKDSLPSDFSVKGDVIVFVDECHRTQSGKLHGAMKAILPDSIFIGFTGTPLLKADKKTSPEIFGGYIHTYKFDEAVRDGVVLDLRYEARDIPQAMTSQAKINEWFEAKTVGLTERAKAKLKEKWGNKKTVFLSKSRLEKIASDIIFDFNTKPRLMDGNGNAILVAGSVYEACQYYEIFQNKGFKKCAVISSYEPYAGSLRTEAVSDEEDTEAFIKYDIYKKMLDGKAVEDFESEVKQLFTEEPYNMKLLIVVDKLLTGFDAPPCTYLYIDREIHDHGLFQAICRVNRLDDESKEFGYIVDYKQLFGAVADAVNTYTAGAFEKYDSADVAGLLKNRRNETKKYFFDILASLDELCRGVKEPKSRLEYAHHFCGESGEHNNGNEALARSREKLYRLVNKLVRAYSSFKPLMPDLGYSENKQKQIADKVCFYINLGEEIGMHSGDFIDLKQYEPGMRYLIDNYIDAFSAETLGVIDDFTLLDFIISKKEALNSGDAISRESAAEAIENNIRRRIMEETVANPAYYASMSEVLEQVILDRKNQAASYKQLIERYTKLAENVSEPEKNSRYPDSVKGSAAARAIYDNCGEDEALAVNLHKAVLTSKQDGFRHNHAKENKIKYALYQILDNQPEVERIYKIIAEQAEY